MARPFPTLAMVVCSNVIVAREYSGARFFYRGFLEGKDDVQPFASDFVPCFFDECFAKKPATFLPGYVSSVAAMPLRRRFGQDWGRFLVVLSRGWTRLFSDSFP
jgi:hypothetical protein